MSISPRSDGHHNNDSNDDEHDDQATAHPLASVLLVLLGLHKLVHARLHMVSGLTHLSTDTTKRGGRKRKREREM